MIVKQFLLIGALWPMAIGARTAGVTSVSYVTTYNATTAVHVWRGVTAELTVHGPSVGKARSVEVVTKGGDPAPGMSASINTSSLGTDVLSIAVTSQSSAALSTYAVKLYYTTTSGSTPDVFLIQLYDHGTVNAIAMDGGVTETVKPGQAYTFTATGSSLQNAGVVSNPFGAGVKDVRILSRSSTSVRVSFVPLYAEASIRIEPSIFYDRNMPPPSRTGPWSYEGTGLATVRTTSLTPSALTFSAPSVLEGEQVTAVVKMNGSVPPSMTKAVVTLSSSSSKVTVPTNVLVVGDNATFVVVAAPKAGLQEVTITAERAGVTVSGTLALQPLVATLQSLKFVDLTLDASPNVQITSLLNEGKQMIVRLNAPVAAASGATVQLTANPAGAVTIPATLTIPAGQSTGTFTVVGEATDVDRVVWVTASLAKAISSRSVTVLRTTIKNIGPENGTGPIKLYSRRDGRFAVELTGRAASSKIVQLSVSRPDLLTISNSLTIGAGATRSATGVLAGVVATDQTASITGALDGIPASGTVSILRLPIPTSITAARSWITSFTLTVTVDRVSEPSNFSLKLHNDNPARLELDDDIVAVGSGGGTSYMFLRTANGRARPSYVAANVVEYPVTNPIDTVPGSVVIRARAVDTLASPHPGVSLTLQLRPYILTLNHSIEGLASAPQMRVSLNHSGGSTITLSTSANAAGRVTIPATVKILPGQRSATYPVTLAPGANISGITFTATLGTLARSVTAP